MQTDIHQSVICIWVMEYQKQKARSWKILKLEDKNMNLPAYRLVLLPVHEYYEVLIRFCWIGNSFVRLLICEAVKCIISFN